MGLVFTWQRWRYGGGSSGEGCQLFFIDRGRYVNLYLWRGLRLVCVSFDFSYKYTTNAIIMGYIIK